MYEYLNLEFSIFKQSLTWNFNVLDGFLEKNKRSLTNSVVDLISKIFLTENEQTSFVNRTSGWVAKNLELKRLFHGICQRTYFIC